MTTRLKNTLIIATACGMLFASPASAGNGTVTAPMAFDSHASSSLGENVAHQFSRGVRHFNADNYDAAKKSFKRVIRYNPAYVHTRSNSRNAMAHYYLGVSEQRLGNHKKAVEYLDYAAAAYPSAPQIYVALASSHTALGNQEKAHRVSIRLNALSERCGDDCEARETIDAAKVLMRKSLNQ